MAQVAPASEIKKLLTRGSHQCHYVQTKFHENLPYGQFRVIEITFFILILNESVKFNIILY
jgi:hypothetical protein